MSGRLSVPRWAKHPALRVFGVVFLLRDFILAALALGGVLTGVLANQDTLSVVAVGLGALALAGVVASTIAGQRRAGGLDTGHHVRAQLYFDEGQTNPRTPEASDEPAPAPPVHVASPTALANQVTGGKKLKADMRAAHDQGVWDDEGWAYRKRVEAWTERTVDVLEGCGRADLASALAAVETPSRPPFETLLKGYSPSYARLVGLLDGRIGLLEESQG
ncbi:MAG: hypothetical protein ACR2H2_16120 [Solirubrobacteraceae bacterium]